MKHFIILLLSVFIFMSCTKKPFIEIQSKTQSFTVEIADSDTERQVGLMNRSKLLPEHGMLFKFQTNDQHGFWMKDTLIPLDIIWISEDKTIVDIQTAQPCTSDFCKTYIPNKKARYVLEVNANTFKGNIGEKLAW